MLSLAAALLIAQAIPPPPPGYVIDKNPYADLIPPWNRDRVVVPVGWTMIGQSLTGSIWAIHDETLTSDRGVVSVWVRVDHSGDKTEPARTTQGRLSVVCGSRKYWWESLSATAPSGGPMPRWSRTSPIDNIPPDSMVEVVWRHVCAT
jgi:hypothetical protein